MTRLVSKRSMSFVKHVPAAGCARVTRFCGKSSEVSYISKARRDYASCESELRYEGRRSRLWRRLLQSHDALAKPREASPHFKRTRLA
jgi:hypothetical protein